jgi:uncharacterized protein
MSQENVQLLRRAFEGFNSHGIDGLLLYLHPEIEWTTTGVFVEAATYCGHEGVRRYIGAWAKEFADLRVDFEEQIDAGDVVVTVGRISGRGKTSGAPVDVVLTAVWSQQDGKIIRLRNFADKAEAFRAAGLSE